MNLTVIGCWSPYPKTNEACSGYLVQHAGTSILMDCGHSVFSHLGKYINPSSLDAVFISHFHPDHYVDLYALHNLIRGLMYIGEREQPLKLFISSQPDDMFQYWSKLPEFEVIRIEDEMDSEVKGIKLKFYEVIHSKPGLAVKLLTGDTSLFYTGDTAYFEKLEGIAKDVDVLLAEATMVQEEKEYAQLSGHMTTYDVGILADKSSCGLLIATHLWPGYDHKQIEQEISSLYKKKFLLAHCGLNLTI